VRDTLPELLNLSKRLGTAEVRDYGLPDSAQARPQSSVFGQDAKTAARLPQFAR
jgi:death-on-curing protein